MGLPESLILNSHSGVMSGMLSYDVDTTFTIVIAATLVKSPYTVTSNEYLITIRNKVLTKDQMVFDASYIW